MFVYMYIYIHMYHVTFSSHLTLYIIKIITINFSSYTLGQFNKFCYVSCIYFIAKRDNSEEYRTLVSVILIRAKPFLHIFVFKILLKLINYFLTHEECVDN